MTESRQPPEPTGQTVYPVLFDHDSRTMDFRPIPREPEAEQNPKVLGLSAQASAQYSPDDSGETEAATIKGPTEKVKLIPFPDPASPVKNVTAARASKAPAKRRSTPNS